MLRRIKSERAGLVESVAAWSAGHRAAAICGWLLVVVLALMSSALFPGEQRGATDPGEAGVGQAMVAAEGDGDSIRENVMIRADDPAARRSVTEDLVATLGRTKGAAADIGSPLGPHGERWVSKDGRADLVTFEVPGPAAVYEGHKAAVLAAVSEIRDRHPAAEIDQAGDSSLSSAVNDGIQGDMKNAEKTSLPLTLIILLIVFGSVVAAGVPLLLAGTAVAGTFGLLQTLGRWVPFNSAASAIVLLIGMAVGIDYSLFYLRRVREERAAGHQVREALRITSRTSGHAVVVSGLTVMICLTGLLFTGVDVFKGLTLGTVLVVGLAVLGSVTVLPALLATLGDRIDRIKLPWLGRRRTAAGSSRAWTAVAAQAVRRPALIGAAAVVLLGALAIPAFGMRLQDAAQTESLPHGVSAAADAAVRMQAEFPGVPTPARVVVSQDTPEVRKAVEGLHAQAAASGGDLGEPITAVAVGKLLEVRVPLAGPGTDAVSVHALKTLRERALPATVGKLGGVEVAVAGRTAMPYDFAQRINARTPAVFAFVAVLAFLLLVLAFRSPALPLVSIALNLLSIGAAYGVLVMIFQDGRLESLLGFNSYGGVVSWLPLFMFVILFGLSMDYHIFILGRIRERRVPGLDTTASRKAIVDGIGASAGVVTSAAVIMVGVFSVFVSLSAIEYKMLGTGMAMAILIDATVVRGVLLPAALALLGDRAWNLPRRTARPGGRVRG
ncbi:MMPL domain-containing protein [Streptomyces sp. 150FB]|uniref:MMPL family transporter n=1 Tax=Streptomyces sp. 150FB TaxID=1576605 RepID=UPI0005896B48|nr:MMPL family transporter [Streptomyces sp. 150FB]KIF76643.1 MMPL domain-containing protein [Streptomyces sp. 150FB]